MFVNISRSKFLVNNSIGNQAIKTRDKGTKYNHCGGAFRNSGDAIACIMCSREFDHICTNCTHVVPAIWKKK